MMRYLTPCQILRSGKGLSRQSKYSCRERISRYGHPIERRNMTIKSFPNAGEAGDWTSQGPERPDVTTEIEKEKEKTTQQTDPPRGQPVRKVD
jgi:hypothetical protein